MTNGKKMEIIRRIHGAGYLCEIDYAPRQSLPNVTIKNNPMHSFAFDYHGGMGVILELRITADRAVRIQDFCDLELLGRPCNVNWWANEKLGVYEFDRGPEYPRDGVLNHRVGTVVKPGLPLEGVLLGCSPTRIPSQYSHGLILPMMLTIVDGFDTPHTAELVVPVDEHLCSKARRPIQSSLYAPRPGNRPKPVDGIDNVVPEGQQYENVRRPPAESGYACLHGKMKQQR